MQNELNLQVEAKTREANQELEKLISILKKVDTTMNSVLKNLNDENTTGKLTKSLDNLTNRAGKLKSALSLGTALEGLKKVTKMAGDALGNSIDYSENLNLFDVAMGDLAEKGMKFQNALNEAFGSNQSETLRFQGIFQAMSKSMGIANEDAYKLSEGLTKIGFDLASLYNISDASAMNKLRAGLAGQTEPLRAVGMDVTENSLKPVIERLNMRDSEGELLTPRQLNYAEKMLLRYIAIVDQAKVSQGDFANTIEAPANQLKILGMQANEAKRALGNLFVGALARILPYANAIIMVIKEVANAIAGVFGIKIGDFNTGIGSLADAFVDVGDSTDAIGNNIDSANKSAQKLQRTLMGFDEIHNITTPTSSGSSGGGGAGGIGGGINPKLLDALSDYDNAMEKVRMKANQIRDAIMKWLGFTYNAEKGIWEFNKGLTPIKVILTAIGALLANKVIKAFKTLGTLLGNTGIGKAVKEALSPLKSLITSITQMYKKTGNLSMALKDSIHNWTAITTVWSRVKLGGVGVLGLFTSMLGMSSSMKSVAENGWTLSNSLGAVVSELGGVASGATIGTAILPGLGTVIGAVAGGVITLSSGIHNYIAQCEALKAYDRLFDNQGVSIEYVKGAMDASLSTMLSYADQTIKLGESYKSARKKANEAKDTINELHGALQANNYQLTEEQLNQLSAAYDDLATNVVIAGQKRTDIIVKNIEKLAEEGRITREEADKMIRAEKEKQLAREDGMKAYTYSLKQLEIDLANGRINQTEYNKKVEELKTKYDIVDDSLLNLDNTYTIWKDRLKEGIDLKNPERLKDLVNQLGEEYKTNKKKIEEARKTSKEAFTGEIEELEQKRAKYDENSEAYKNLTKEIEELKTKSEETAKGYSDNMATLEGTYKGVLATIYTEIQSSGNKLTDDVKTVKSKVENTLGSIGKDVKMTGVGKEIFDSLIADLAKNENPFLSNLKSGFNKYGIEGGKAFNKAIKLTEAQKLAEQQDKAKLGKSAVEGYSGEIASGNAKTKINKAIRGFTTEAHNAVRNYDDTHSPSKVYQGFGAATIEGYVKGINDNQNKVTSAIKTLLDKAQKQFTDRKLNININTNVEGSFNSILNKLQTFVNRWRDAINSLARNMSSTMNNIKVNGSGKVSYTAMPKINIPRFANGGFPEDGFFYANHNELVGQFANGKTAVANNEQILDGIKQGVYEAMLTALSQTNIGGGVAEIIVKHEDGMLVERAIRGINRETVRTGQCPIKVM